MSANSQEHIFKTIKKHQVLHLYGEYTGVSKKRGDLGFRLVLSFEVFRGLSSKKFRRLTPLKLFRKYFEYWGQTSKLF